MLRILMLRIFIQDSSSSVLRLNCYQRRFCVRGPSAFNSPFGHGSRSLNIRPLDIHLSGLSISLSRLALSWVYRLPFFKSSYFDMTRLWLELTTFRSGGERSTFTLPVGEFHFFSSYFFRKESFRVKELQRGRGRSEFEFRHRQKPVRRNAGNCEHSYRILQHVSHDCFSTSELL